MKSTQKAKYITNSYVKKIILVLHDFCLFVSDCNYFSRWQRIFNEKREKLTMKIKVDFGKIYIACQTI